MSHAPALLLPVLLLALAGALPWALTRPGRGRPVRRDAGPETAGPVDAAVLLDLAEAALAAGASVPGALRALGRANPRAVGDRSSVAEALDRAGSALLLGADWEEAFAGAPAPVLPLAEALQPAWLDGAAPGPLLRRAAAALRAGRHQQAQEAAARLGVRLVLPLGLCFLPAFVLLGVLPVVLAAGGQLLGR